MSLAAGTRFGTYEIIDLIGVGGMGEVYRARDARLKRDVAIKILPEALAAEPERISRFEREAELLASLNHSNIAIVHDFQKAEQRHFLVMELVEGETLADRLRRGPLLLDETLQVARQIAEALEAAHQKGIIHRDLKPGNIKIGADGKVKVLDFGLAKIFGNTAGTLDAANSPTLMSGTAGVILGTAAYMSPEQARGKAVEKRTDIWALGCVIYEALTGKQAFEGDNVSDTIAAVIRGEPDWSALPPGTPRRVRTLLERCLRKDPRHRLHDAADVRIEIDDAGAADPVVATAPPAKHNRLLPMTAGLAAGLAIAGIVAWFAFRSSGETREPMHLSISLGSDSVSIGGSFNAAFAISPNGKWIVYPVVRSGKQQLFLRGIQDYEGRLISGTEDLTNPFFSPDSQWIGFGSGKELKKVPVSGGSPVTICSCVSGFVGGAWGSDNRIAFVPDWNLGIWTVSVDGGMPQLLLKTDEAKDRVAFDAPQWLPQGKGILFVLWSGQTTRAEDGKIAVLEAGATEPRILIQGGTSPSYLPSGHLLYVRAGALLSVPFDLSRLAVTGTPSPVVEGLELGFNGGSYYGISQNGALIYEPASGIQGARRFVMIDRKGEIQPITERRGLLTEFSLSKDGKHIAARVVAVNDDVWTFDVATGTPLRLTSEPLDELYPQWTPDGTRIAFSTRTGKIFWKPADGATPREELSHGEYPRWTGSFSPDGKTLAFVEIHPSRQGDIWLLPLEGDRKAQPLLATDADERFPKFSPDGRWLAYTSNETGRNEIYVRPIGPAGGRKRISTEGGTDPRWARSGRELFFTKGDKLASVTLDAEANPVGKDRIILDAPKLDDLVFLADFPLYDVMPDGEHFVMVLAPRYPPPTHYNVIINWFEELKRKMGS